MENTIPTVCSIFDKGYRYGFNGKELDKNGEGMGGGGSTYDYGFRIYNPNLSKFLSIDPLSKNYAMLTPFQFASNTPIRAIDLDGLESAEVGKNNPFLVIVILGRAGGMYGDKTEQGKTQYKNLPPPYNKGDDGLSLLGQYAQCNIDPVIIVFAGSDDDMTSKDVAQTIKNYRVTNPEGKIIIIGHSLGGKDAIDAAILVENDTEIKNKTIDVVITLEPACTDDAGSPYSDALGCNVKNSINYNSNKSSYNSGAGATSSSCTNSSSINLPAGTNHTNMDNTLTPLLGSLLHYMFETNTDPVRLAGLVNYNNLPILNNGDLTPAAEGGTSDDDDDEDICR